MTRGLVHLSCDNRLREMGLLSLGKRRFQGDPLVAFQYLTAKKRYGKLEMNFDKRAYIDRPKGKIFKLKEDRFG